MRLWFEGCLIKADTMQDGHEIAATRELEAANLAASSPDELEPVNLDYATFGSEKASADDTPER